MVLDRLKPRDSMGFLTWKSARIFTNELAARFAASGLDITVEQWRALLPLSKFDGLNQGNLCGILNQEKTGVSRLVAALEKRGLVRRVQDESDRRVKRLFITDAGRRLLETSVDIVIDCRDEMVNHIDPDDVAVCKRVLWQIVVRYAGDCAGKCEE
ncbi:MarR family winged helix-turn-helix transcriptional regulator [Pseudodesulfovibrio tunisiensis]|uniref:MarR family winged helix-turn-helix transcriptional regulator n=1 Tax=Pseudodesulfovibrio tunisiensis TaxID=463192 RepID=UPI001FB3B16C|nr:MarR family transcriptional regulator [Pseudodesulfovibrio tunisiensis]